MNLVGATSHAIARHTIVRPVLFDQPRVPYSAVPLARLARELDPVERVFGKREGVAGHSERAVADPQVGG